ncbi:hypothetical protein BpHYR1_024154, partial [Brachionus plicatilis]
NISYSPKKTKKYLIFFFTETLFQQSSNFLLTCYFSFVHSLSLIDWYYRTHTSVQKFRNSGNPKV